MPLPGRRAQPLDVPFSLTKMQPLGSRANAVSMACRCESAAYCTKVNMCSHGHMLALVYWMGHMLCGHRGVVVLLQSYCSQTVPACRSCLSMFKSLTRAAWTDACTVLVLLRSLHRDYWWTAPWTAPGSRVFVQCIYFLVFMQLSLMACL